MRLLTLLIVIVVLGSACGAGQQAELVVAGGDPVETSTPAVSSTTPPPTTLGQFELWHIFAETPIEDDSYFIDLSQTSSTCQDLAALIIPVDTDRPDEADIENSVALLSELDSTAGEYLRWIATDADPTSDQGELGVALHTIEKVSYQACGFPLLQASDGLSIARFCNVGMLDSDEEAVEPKDADDCNRNRFATRLPCFVPVDPKPTIWTEDLFLPVACGLEYDIEVHFTIDGWKVAT